MESVIKSLMSASTTTNDTPIKRRRVDSDDVSLDQCTRHPNLYMEDGNIVLVCEYTLFKVYRGLLSRNSEVFCDMFALSSHQPTDAEQWDGSPIVRLHDLAEDFGNFLTVLLDAE